MPDTKLEQLEADIEEYDEVHAVIAELDDEKDFRQKDTTIDHDTGLVTVDNGITFRRYHIDHFVYWTPPRDF